MGEPAHRSGGRRIGWFLSRPAPARQAFRNAFAPRHQLAPERVRNHCFRSQFARPLDSDHRARPARSRLLELIPEQVVAGCPRSATRTDYVTTNYFRTTSYSTHATTHGFQDACGRLSSLRSCGLPTSFGASIEIPRRRLPRRRGSGVPRLRVSAHRCHRIVPGSSWDGLKTFSLVIDQPVPCARVSSNSRTPFWPGRPRHGRTRTPSSKVV